MSASSCSEELATMNLHIGQRNHNLADVLIFLEGSKLYKC